MVNSNHHRMRLALSYLILAGMWLCAYAQTVFSSEPDDFIQKAKHAHLENIVHTRLAFYAKQFPDINFIILDSAGDTERNLHLLMRILGQDPIPLDYAHPTALNHTLLMAALMRIQLLLQTDAGSATLFAPGEGAVARRKYVCVITLAPWSIASDDRAATRHLLELTDTQFKLVPRSHYLNHKSHLQFAIDHEIYHCLDTIYNGPIQKSQYEHWGDYQMLRNEDGADAYATIMQIAEHDSKTRYVQILENIRALVLLGGDPDHYTPNAIAAVLKLKPFKLARENTLAHVRLASTIRNRVVGGYQDYLRYACAAERAMKLLGVDISMRKYNCKSVDMALVKKLIIRTHKAYHSLTGEKFSSDN